MQTVLPVVRVSCVRHVAVDKCQARRCQVTAVPGSFLTWHRGAVTDSSPPSVYPSSAVPCTMEPPEHPPGRVSVFFHPRMLEHDTGRGFFELVASPLLEVVEQHPENADRLRNIVSVLRKGPLSSSVDWVTPNEAALDDMRLVHTPEHLAGLQEASATAGGKRYGVSTVLPQGGWGAITLACGSACGAVDAVENRRRRARTRALAKRRDRARARAAGVAGR